MSEQVRTFRKGGYAILKLKPEGRFIVCPICKKEGIAEVHPDYINYTYWAKDFIVKCPDGHTWILKPFIHQIGRYERDVLYTKFSEDGKKKYCLWCDKMLRGRQWNYCCPECSDKWNVKFSHTHFQRMREKILERAGYKCELCGGYLRKWCIESIKNGNPNHIHWSCKTCEHNNECSEGYEIHHKKRVIDNPELERDADNLMAICRKCHKSEHKKEAEERRRLKEEGKKQREEKQEIKEPKKHLITLDDFT
jgi:hypothetical protein